MMSDEEVEAIRRFVADGGKLYASGYSSLIDENGRFRPDFGLTDIFGVSYKGPGIAGLSFVAPKENDFLQFVFPQQQLIHKNGQLSIKTTSASTVATIALPYCNEDEGTVLKPSFSSIHSNPPAPTTPDPAITFNKRGNSQVCYCAGSIEAEPQPINRLVSAFLIRKLLGEPPSVEAQGPRFIEITVFERKEQNRLNISLVSLLEDGDCIPCDVSVAVRLGQRKRVVALRSLPQEKSHPYKETVPGVIEFDVHGLKILEMFELEYTDPGIPNNV